MSTGFDILISPGDSFNDEPLEFYKRILRLALSSSGIRREGAHLAIYKGQRPFDYGPGSNDPRVLVNRRFDGEQWSEELLNAIEEVTARDVYIGASLGYDRWHWNNDVCNVEASSGALVVEYESFDFALGHAARARGSHRIHFDDRKYFTQLVVDLSRCPADSPEALIRLVKYGDNVKFVLTMFRKICNTLRPANMLIVTEGDRVNPANFHMVYHDRLSGFLFDVRKMLQLHRSGGGYFYEGRTDSRDAAYQSLGVEGSAYEDDIRSADRAYELAKQLDSYAEEAGVNGIDELSLEDEAIFQVLTSFPYIEAEAIGDGVSVMHSKFLFGYLDALYLKLLVRAVNINSDYDSDQYS